MADTKEEIARFSEWAKSNYSPDTARILTRAYAMHQLSRILGVQPTSPGGIRRPEQYPTQMKNPHEPIPGSKRPDWEMNPKKLRGLKLHEVDMHLPE